MSPDFNSLDSPANQFARWEIFLKNFRLVGPPKSEGATPIADTRIIRDGKSDYDTQQ